MEIPYKPSRSNPMMKQESATVYLDIETIPTQESVMQEYVLKSLKAPGNYKDTEKIAAYLEEAKEDALDKCGLDGATNHIICIGVAIDDHDPISFSAEKYSHERKMLEDFYKYVAGNLPYHGNVFVGHNVSGFDLKVIRQRGIVLAVKPGVSIPFDAKPWDLNPFDTMIQWDSKNFIKLEKLALALGIKTKKTMEGSEVYGAWKNGLHEQIAEYCRNDVALVREVYKRMVF